MMRIFPLSLALLGAALSGAGIAAPAQTPPPAEGPSADAPDVLHLSLDEAVALAHQRSFRAARARRNHRISELRHGIARTGYLPRADVGATVEQSARGFQYESDRYRDFTQPIRGEFRSVAGVGASVPLDMFGVIKRQVSQADLARQISGHDVALSGLDAAFEAQHAYLTALRAQRSVEADERVAAQLEDLLQRARSDAPAAVPFLEVELANARQALTSSRTMADQAADGVKQVLRLPLETRLRLVTSVEKRLTPLDRNDLLERALTARPDVQQAALRMRQSRIYTEQVLDQRKPSISVGGFYNQQLFARNIFGADRDRFGAHGFGLIANIPLARWDNGQLRKQKQIASVQEEQVAADAAELQERLTFELKQALLAIDRAENRIRSLPDPDQAFQAMKRAEEGMLRAANGHGQALLAQVSNARNIWRSAETASAEAYIDYQLALFRLKRVIGQTHVAAEGAEPPAPVSDRSAAAGAR